MSGASPERFTFLVNGIEHTLEADGNSPLLDALRNTLGLKGTRFGCGNEECGACFVLVDGHAVPSCETPLWAIEIVSDPDCPAVGVDEAAQDPTAAAIANTVFDALGVCARDLPLTAERILAIAAVRSLQVSPRRSCGGREPKWLLEFGARVA